jgi:hypothetical protein
VALQGTIDAFPLTDVLQLLSSSARSGWLLVQGDRGRAALHIDQGAVVGGLGGVAAPTSAAQLVTEVLRFVEGSFVFGAEDPPAGEQVVVEPLDIMSCIAAAEEFLGRWQGLDAVVPSGAHRVELPEELVEESVVLTRVEWPLLVAAGHGMTVRDTGAWLGLSELDCAASIAALVARGLLRVVEPAPFDPVPGPATSFEPVAGFEPVSGFEPVAAYEPVGGFEPATGFEPASGFEPATGFEPVGASDPGAPAPAFAHDTPDADFPDRFPIDDLMGTPEADVFAEPPVAPATEEPTDELLRQMSRLSPKAAEAIAAALGAAPAASVPPATPSTLLEEPHARDNDGPITFSGSF